MIRKFSITIDRMLSNLANTGRGKKQLLSVIVDCCLVWIALWCAYRLRVGAGFHTLDVTWYYYLILPIFTVPTLAGLGVYRWVVRSSNLALAKQMIKGGIISAMVLMVLLFMLPSEHGAPRSLAGIYAVLFIGLTLTVRGGWRLLLANGIEQLVNPVGEPTAIFGSGPAGQELASVMAISREARPVLFLEGNDSLHGSMVSGLPVFNPSRDGLSSVLANHEIKRIVVADPTLSREDYLPLLESADLDAIRIQRVPSVNQLVSGQVSLKGLREFSIDDLLGRDVIPPNITLLNAAITGKSIMVTGGGGSIGSELCRQIIKLQPALLLIVDHSEENLYTVSEDLNKLKVELNATNRSINEPDSAAGHGLSSVVTSLCSVTDAKKIGSLLNTHRIQSVFHAAAYKHVPIIEDEPIAGYINNVRGTQCVLDAAIEAGVQNFTLVSTDKAVRPTSVMGATKRVAELVLQGRAAQPHGMVISMVRFGNVLGSSGSVVPKFQQQIEAGGPVTLTHPKITRFFMTVEEAAQLVLQSSGLASSGSVFVLDMGKPVKIINLATDMIRLAGHRARLPSNTDAVTLSDTASRSHSPDYIDIVYTGLRPGEKLYEELFIDEDAKPTEIGKLWVVQEPFLSWSDLGVALNRCDKACDDGDGELLKRQLFSLVSRLDKDADTPAMVQADDAQPVTSPLASSGASAVSELVDKLVEK